MTKHLWLYNDFKEEIPFTQLTFPDGQRHIELTGLTGEEHNCTIEARIANANELFDVLLLKDALDANGKVTSLDIRYLLGARMDRRIDHRQPATLDLVARHLLQAGFRRIRVLDPHSERACKLLGATAVMPHKVVDRIMATYHWTNSVVVAPDKGATDRVRQLAGQVMVAQALKKRDPQTGYLSQFELTDPLLVRERVCLILDDICDGGRTFTGLAKLLLEKGATAVDLYVTHGIFSASCKLAGIRRIYTTDSYYDLQSEWVTCYPVSMSSV